MSKPNLVAIGFALGYLLICLFISGLHFEGSWGGLLMFFLALPFSIFSTVASKSLGGMPAFLIMNTLWWYFLVRLFCYFYMKRK